MMNRPRYVHIVATLLGFLVPSIALACLWDHDTIKMERTRFPSTLELITGKFLRHSPEFYQWRIEDRLKRLKSDPSNVALLDDLAVAYDKVGQHDKAIETAQRTEQIHPGRYETAANLGSFYFHAGKLKEGLPHIDRALGINPDAHFGREKYQKLLVEYILKQRQEAPLKLPLAEVTIWPGRESSSPSAPSVMVRENFYEFLFSGRQGESPKKDEVSAAVKGILGMMKFGKHDAPVLLEALGALLTQPESRSDAKFLAARAYLKASYEVPEGTAREAYRGMAARALWLKTPPNEENGQIGLETVEEDFLKEQIEARVWYAKVREQELAWISKGQDPEAEFDKLYDKDPEVSGMVVPDPISGHSGLKFFFLLGYVFLFLILAVVLIKGVAKLIRTMGPVSPDQAGWQEIKLTQSERAGFPRATVDRMSIGRAMGTILVCMLLLAFLGASVGYGLGTHVPVYYRSVFLHGHDKGFDPVSVGVALGLTQGLAGGVFVGLAVVALFCVRDILMQRGAALPETARKSARH